MMWFFLVHCETYFVVIIALILVFVGFVGFDFVLATVVILVSVLIYLLILCFSLDKAIVVGEFVGDGVRGVDTLLLASLIPKLRFEVRFEVRFDVCFFALCLLRGELDTNVFLKAFF